MGTFSVISYLITTLRQFPPPPTGNRPLSPSGQLALSSQSTRFANDQENGIWPLGSHRYPRCRIPSEYSRALFTKGLNPVVSVSGGRDSQVSIRRTVLQDSACIILMDGEFSYCGPRKCVAPNQSVMNSRGDPGRGHASLCLQRHFSADV